MNNLLKFKMFPIVVMIIIVPVISAHAQISVQMNEIQSIYMPGTQLAMHVAPISSVDIGQTGGPNIYDFSNVSFTDTLTTFIDSVSIVPELVNRYSSTSIVWGIIPSGNRINNQIFEFSNNSMLRHGQVSLFPDSLRFTHLTPPSELVLFPAVYNASWNVSFLGTDTTYVQGVATNISSTNYTKSTIIDGYGTLSLPDTNFECLRMKRIHATPQPSDNEYWYLTKDGTLLIVNGAISQPDTGIVQILNVVLFKGATPTDINKLSKMPYKFSLYQNFPNPFNPSTKIKYELPKTEKIKIEIFNMLGQKIKTLVNKTISVGLHEVEFNSGNLPSGVYLYRISAGEVQEVKKMVLLR
jgi:hypothetical protein